MSAAALLRVLIVDDSYSMRLIIRGSLQQIGFRDFEEAVDGEDGLRKLVATPAHLVISDYNMPNLDGLGLLRAVRTHPSTAKIAYIMLTGRADKDLVQKAIRSGVNDYLVKPFSVAALKEKIEAVFGALT